ncbi:MAG: hypothetical protein EBZ48_10220, partial [Proteobacteria bacterium]|nr:hypothetical protein [Pseudomonadota bacterium]
MNQPSSDAAGSPTQFFQVRLDLFDGPIDLLLHLVKQNELPIEKISLAQVTSQYLDCIERMRDLDLEIAGEYLVIAATLVSIKSSIVLNQPVEFVADEDGNLIDPHEELLRRLREAEVYRDGARHLATRHLLGVDVFSAPGVVFPGEEPELLLKNHDALLLGKALHRLLQKAGDAAPLMTISVDAVSIVERMVGVLDLLKLHSAGTTGEGLSFERLVADRSNRGAIISTFLAVLELCKRQVVQVRQSEAFEDIVVELRAVNVDANRLTSEYEITADGITS